jgi:DtxR family Mn-dependent transcriptional regulator
MDKQTESTTSFVPSIDHGTLLASLKPGQKARVVQLTDACVGTERRRLLDLGFVPGTLIEVEMVSPSGDPTAYRVRGTQIALRREQAVMIAVELATD